MASGIICEYNPFHKGHAYQMRETCRKTGDPDIICIMSGNYTQRGEPAICDKWLRSRMALEAGAALVIELPTYYSTATAQFFAQGGVQLAEATGLISHLSFGIEPGAESILRQAAEVLVTQTTLYEEKLQELLPTSNSFAEAREKALCALLPACSDEELHLLTAPNTILALEYLLQLQALDSDIHPLMIPRQSAGYHNPDITTDMPSATALRLQLLQGADISHLLPESVRATWQNAVLSSTAPLGPALQYALSHHTPESLAAIAEVGEGLENRILRESVAYPGWEELLSSLATKRYPTARLRRILLNIYLNITTEARAAVNFTQGPGYIRVLGFRKDRETLLSQLCKTASLPVVTSVVRPPALSPAATKMLQDEIHFTDLYMSTLPRTRDQEYRMPLVII